MPMQQWIPPGIMTGGVPLPPPATAPANTPPGPQGPLWLQKFAGGFNKFANGLSGYAPSPYLSPEENQALQQRQRAATFAQLAASSGPTVAGTTGPLQAFGQATAAGLNAGQSGVEDAIKARLANAQMQHLQAGGSLIGSASPSDFTPASLAKYKQTQNPADLVPIEKNMFGRFQPRDYTPESLNVFEQTHNPGDLRRIANYQPQQLPGGGIGSFNPVSGQIDTTPVPNVDAQAQAAALARAKAEATTIGEATGKSQAAILTKAMNADGIKDILDIADPLIDESTGSGSGAIRDKLAAFFGISTTGAQATAQLLPLQAALMLRQPRMEGPQSDRDVQLYRDAAGQIGDPTVPRETKKAAMKTIRELQDKYAEEGKSLSTPAPKSAGTIDWKDLK